MGKTVISMLFGIFDGTNSPWWEWAASLSRVVLSARLFAQAPYRHLPGHLRVAVLHVLL